MISVLSEIFYFDKNITLRKKSHFFDRMTEQLNATKELLRFALETKIKVFDLYDKKRKYNDKDRPKLLSIYYTEEIAEDFLDSYVNSLVVSEFFEDKNLDLLIFILSKVNYKILSMKNDLLPRLKLKLEEVSTRNNIMDKNLALALLSFYYKFRYELDSQTTSLVMQCVLNKITSATNIFMVLEWISFFIDVENPNIHEMLKPHLQVLSHYISVYGNMMNVGHLAMIIKLTSPTFGERLEMIKHVSTGCISYIMTTLSEAKDIHRLPDMDPSFVFPHFYYLIQHEFFYFSRSDLFEFVFKFKAANSGLKKLQEFYRKFEKLFLDMDMDLEYDLASSFVNAALRYNKSNPIYAIYGPEKKCPYMIYAMAVFSKPDFSKTEMVQILRYIFESSSNSYDWVISAVLILYSMNDKSVLEEIKDLIQDIKNPVVRILYTLELCRKKTGDIYFTYLKNCYPPYSYDKLKLTNLNVVEEKVPVQLQATVVRALFQCDKAKTDELKITDPLLINFRKRDINVDSMNYFSFLDPVQVCAYMAGVQDPKSYHQKTYSIKRDFHLISPAYHSVRLEIESEAWFKESSIKFRVRLTPSNRHYNVMLSIETFRGITPAKPYTFEFGEIESNKSYVRSFAYSIHSVEYPYILISLKDGVNQQSPNTLLECRVCLPLLDLFSVMDSHSNPKYNEIKQAVWGALACREYSKLCYSEQFYVSKYGVFATKDNDCRASSPDLLQLIPSIVDTNSVI